MSPPPLIDVRIRCVSLEADEVLSFALEPLGGEALPAFEPGAHVDVHLPTGLVRQYSLTNDSDGRCYLIAVGLDRNSRGGSRWLHLQARPGDRLRISAPRNSFALGETPAPVLLIAGGIGVTPLHAMARRLARQGRPWSLRYGARSRRGAAFVEALELLGDDVATHFDDEAGGVMDVARIVAEAPADAHIYACGPAAMMEAVRLAYGDRPADRIHFEFFAPAPHPAAEGGFVVELARSEMMFEVPADKSILDVLVENGIAAPASCRVGVCGTCETRVLDGRPDHRDRILSEAERASDGTMMICCSRSLTPSLRLDM